MEETWMDTWLRCTHYSKGQEWDVRPRQGKGVVWRFYKEELNINFHKMSQKRKKIKVLPGTKEKYILAFRDLIKQFPHHPKWGPQSTSLHFLTKTPISVSPVKMTLNPRISWLVRSVLWTKEGGKNNQTKSRKLEETALVCYKIFNLTRKISMLKREK